MRIVVRWVARRHHDVPRSLRSWSHQRTRVTVQRPQSWRRLLLCAIVVIERRLARRAFNSSQRSRRSSYRRAELLMSLRRLGVIGLWVVLLWRRYCGGVESSLEEAGLRLLEHAARLSGLRPLCLFKLWGLELRRCWFLGTLKQLRIQTGVILGVGTGRRVPVFLRHQRRAPHLRWLVVGL